MPEIGLDQATVEIMAALRCGLQLRVRALFQQGLKRIHGRKNYGAFEIENLVLKILLQKRKAFSSVIVPKDGIYGKGTAYS